MDVELNRQGVIDNYYRWLLSIIAKNRFCEGASFYKLLDKLHKTEFIAINPLDENRYVDGIDLRYRYAIHECNFAPYSVILSYLDGPCSILEMMVALSLNCEEKIMDDTRYGNRTAQWFWEMIKSLGLSGMTDLQYDEEYVNYVLNRFLKIEYEPNGNGGLFTLRHCDKDVRKVEIWCQLCWYLNEVY